MVSGAERRHLGPDQFSTDNAVMVAKQIIDGKEFESLEFMDEMISVISGGRRAKGQYNERCQIHKSGHNMILSREA